MQNGYVFMIAPSLFGIFLFVEPFIMCRFDAADDVDEACLAFGMKFAGNFKPANAAQEKAARSMMKHKNTLVLCDN